MKVIRNCAYCQRPMLPGTATAPTRDHMIPLSRGGLNVRANIVMACFKCNSVKGNMLPDEWAAFNAENPNWWAIPGGEAKAKRKARALRVYSTATDDDTNASMRAALEKAFDRALIQAS